MMFQVPSLGRGQGYQVKEEGINMSILSKFEISVYYVFYLLEVDTKMSFAQSMKVNGRKFSFVINTMTEVLAL